MFVAKTPTHRRYRDHLTVIVLATVGVDLICAVLAFFFERHAAQSLAPSSVPLTAVATDPTSGLIYTQENGGTKFFVYDPRTNAWSELAPSPLSSGNNGDAAYLGGRIYVVYTGNENEIAVYDIFTSSWTTLPNPLRGRHGRHHGWQRDAVHGRERKIHRVRPRDGHHHVAG